MLILDWLLKYEGNQTDLPSPRKKKLCSCERKKCVRERTVKVPLK